MELKEEQEKYFMEGNAAEILRLSFQHEVLKEYVGKLVLAPIDLDKPALRVIDSATADGKKRFRSRPRAQGLIVCRFMAPRPSERLACRRHIHWDGHCRIILSATV